MESQYESRFLATDEMVKEYIKKVLKSFFRKALFILFFVIIFAYSYNLKENIPLITTVGVLCIFADIAFGILLFHQIKKTASKLHAGKEYETIVQFGEKISMKEGTFSLGLEYTQISKIYYLKHSCALMFTRLNGILTSPNHFTKGDFESFQKFIQEKCPKAKIIKKS